MACNLRLVVPLLLSVLSNGNAFLVQNNGVFLNSLTQASLQGVSTRPLFGKRRKHDDDDVIDISDRDWRAFRAKLVLTETDHAKQHEITMVEVEEEDLDGIGSIFTSEKTGGFTPLEPSQWAYDSGKIIERGAVILGGVEQDFGFGLSQQYFHKAVILVLDHDESHFTKGIILNRPSDLVLQDEINHGVQWKVWFGGDVQGLESVIPDIICLHSIKDNLIVQQNSKPVMKDIQYTSFDQAKKLVKIGAAKPSDFWVFAGYAGWGPRQLMSELDRNSWYMCATDSQTLLKELKKNSVHVDPRDAGLDTWDTLMHMIGRGDIADDYYDIFDDLMLKEWARKRLMSIEAGGGAGKKIQPPDVASTGQLLKADPFEKMLSRMSTVSHGEDIREGTLVRGSSAERSPFLLDKQEYHKSIVLVISDNENATVGVMLNHPGSKGLDLEVYDKDTKELGVVTMPLRYGGEYAVKGQDPLLWLHNSQTLRIAQIGTPFGDDEFGFYRCTKEEVDEAIILDLATPDDFMVVSGVSVWPKGEKGNARGMQGEVQMGRFEVIPTSQTQRVWETLQQQQILTSLNLTRNLATANDAWEQGADGMSRRRQNNLLPRMHRMSEGYSEEDDSLVFKTGVKVSRLSNDAMRSWVATFLLGAPTLGA